MTNGIFAPSIRYSSHIEPTQRSSALFLSVLDGQDIGQSFSNILSQLQETNDANERKKQNKKEKIEIITSGGIFNANNHNFIHADLNSGKQSLDLPNNTTGHAFKSFDDLEENTEFPSDKSYLQISQDGLSVTLQLNDEDSGLKEIQVNYNPQTKEIIAQMAGSSQLMSVLQRQAQMLEKSLASHGLKLKPLRLITLKSPSSDGNSRINRSPDYFEETEDHILKLR